MFKTLFHRQRTKDNIRNITPLELKEHLDNNADLIVLDVRSADEFAKDGHIVGSRHLPLSYLPQRYGELPNDQTIVCICRSGNRSLVASQQLTTWGFAPVFNLTGGLQAWQRMGYHLNFG